MKLLGTREVASQLTGLCMALSPLMHCYPFVGGEIFAVCNIPFGFPSGTECGIQNHCV